MRYGLLSLATVCQRSFASLHLNLLAEHIGDGDILCDHDILQGEQFDDDEDDFNVSEGDGMVFVCWIIMQCNLQIQTKSETLTCY